MPKLLDTYTFIARFLPVILSALPIFIFWFYLSDNVQFKELVSFILSIKFLGSITFSIAVFYLYSLTIREISKHFQRKYFTGDEARGFPTTYLMTYTNSTFSDCYKDKYRNLILDRFDFELLNKEEEKADPIEGKKRLNEATELVKEVIGDGRLVLDHNIRFGFCRNFIGGTIISMLLCVAFIILGVFWVENYKSLSLTLGILFFIYLALFILRKPILVYNGEAYAKKLLAEFMVSKPRT